MDLTQNRYWPFEVLPIEQMTEEQRREIRFLETAYQAGYKPYMSGSQDYGATAGERSGFIIYRGCRGKHREVRLGTAVESSLSVHLDDFDYSAEAVLNWLCGMEVDEILENVRDHLFRDGMGRAMISRPRSEPATFASRLPDRTGAMVDPEVISGVQS